METGFGRKLPLWVWVVMIPFAQIGSMFVVTYCIEFALKPLHLKPTFSYEDAPGPSDVEYLATNFLGPCLAGIVWCKFAPMRRYVGAMWMAATHALPCCICSNIGFDRPPADVMILMLFGMAFGCIIPILFYCYIDRDKLKGVRL